MSTLREVMGTFMILPHWILLRMWNLSDNSCRKIRTCILCSV